MAGRKPGHNGAPRTYRELQNLLTARFDDLSGQLQRIAHFVVDHPNTLALGNGDALATGPEAVPAGFAGQGIAALEHLRAGVPATDIARAVQLLSRLRVGAAVRFQISDAERPVFRSLVAPICLAQTPVVSLGACLEGTPPKTRKNKPR